MPHKKNPILSENLTGLARLIRSCVIPALENVSLWHERDISHSAVERNIGPDANITTDFALVRLANILNNIIVYPKKMIENLDLTKGLIFSQEVMLELTKTGLSREKSYKIVQSYAKKCFSESFPKVFKKFSENYGIVVDQKDEWRTVKNNKFWKKVTTCVCNVKKM